MSFNPLGSFDVSAPVNPKILAKALALYKSLPTIPAGGITRLFLHWSVSPYDATFPDYNGMVTIPAGSSDWELSITCDPSNNAPGLNNNPEASHTWHRNTGACGIAIAAMGGASMSDYGQYPVTDEGLEHLCVAAAAFALKYGIEANGTVPSPGSDHAGDNGNVNTTGEPVIMTHDDAAFADSYACGYSSDGNCRWDLRSFVAAPPGVALTRQMGRQSSDALRQRTHTLKVALQGAV